MQIQFHVKNDPVLSVALDLPAKSWLSIEDCAKDGGEEFFSEMHCLRITNL